MAFSDIPLRSNGERIEASWFNTLRLELTQGFGDVIGETNQAIGDTDTAQDITVLSAIDKAEFKSVDVEYRVRRKDDGSDVVQKGKISFDYNIVADTWVKDGDQSNILHDDALISFIVFEDKTGGGNKLTVRYSTTTLGGGGVHTGNLGIKGTKWVG